MVWDGMVWAGLGWEFRCGFSRMVVILDGVVHDDDDDDHYCCDGWVLMIWIDLARYH